MGEAELRERGKMKELTQNEAHNVSTNLVHWGEKEKEEREREWPCKTFKVNVSELQTFSIDYK